MTAQFAWLVGAVAAMVGSSLVDACPYPEARGRSVVTVATRPGMSQARVVNRSLADELRAEDARAFFDRLVERYRALSGYRDSAKLLQVTTRAGQVPQSVRTQLTCAVERDEMRVQTPAAQATGMLGLDALLEISPAARMLRQRYQLWLAPHMSLRFAEQPLREMRAGVEGELKPIVAEHVVVDEKALVHVQLQSERVGGEAPAASVDLYVDPDSMLVQRVESQQRLADGTHCATTLEITPEFVDGGEVEDAKPRAADENVPVVDAPAQDEKPAAPVEAPQPMDPQRMTPGQ
jgi:hypothetical protein